MSIETKVRKIIAEKLPNLDIEDVVPEASLVDDLGADSLTIVELLMTMEEVFEIDIDEDETDKLTTVQDAINYIQSKF
ncbi:acyl carrier protein (ACP) [Desulfamplus magnetovallimortis]|uniref:Acyl carrier protein n=1 Tax=Desulfamplus magnetovallimortis TaxID=1246637 RepID=A0A1W1H9Z9_9BACT|nr:acyl carrier protein [Desulfamplus magnetovallimortis]SLM29297.1 acyl carrier protein (ACP) [Desulfamplus magnetovallimortis]